MFDCRDTVEAFRRCNDSDSLGVCHHAMMISGCNIFKRLLHGSDVVPARFALSSTLTS